MRVVTDRRMAKTLPKNVVKILEKYHFGVNHAKSTKKMTADYDNSTSFKKKHVFLNKRSNRIDAP